MQKINSRITTILSGIVITTFLFSGCEKPPPPDQDFDLNVSLWGGKSAGLIKFRQDPDATKIVDLDVKIYHLAANHDYLLQRAVDAVNEVDGNCTSTGWLTLGKGLTPQAIHTDNFGSGGEMLWRDVSAVPSGSKFDIHFQIIDALSLAVVLTSDCHHYTVR